MYTDLEYDNFEKELIILKSFNKGKQWIFKFNNGHGVSVVKHSFSYGHWDDLFELAFISFDDDGNWEFDCENEILKDETYNEIGDVLGHLTNDDVLEILGRIKLLK